MNRSNRKSPIKIEGDTSINYEMITQFVSTKKRNATVNKDLVEEAIQDLDINLDSATTNKVEVSARCSDSTCQSIALSIACLHHQRGVSRCKEMVSALISCDEGSKRRGKSSSTT